MNASKIFGKSLLNKAHKHLMFETLYASLNRICIKFFILPNKIKRAA